MRGVCGTVLEQGDCSEKRQLFNVVALTSWPLRAQLNYTWACFIILIEMKSVLLFIICCVYYFMTLLNFIK